MDMRIEYANHLGETLELGPESVYHYGKHTLFDAELAYEVENGSVGPLTRDPAERELPIMVHLLFLYVYNNTNKESCK